MSSWSYAYQAGGTSRPRDASHKAWDVYLVLGTSETSRMFEEDCPP